MTDTLKAPDGSTFFRDTAPAFDSHVLRINAKKRNRRPVILGDVRYESFRPPKTLASMRIASAAKTAEQDPEALIDAIGEWLVAAFGDDDGRAVFARLFAGDDDLDVDAIMDLIQKTLEVAAGDPTG